MLPTRIPQGSRRIEATMNMNNSPDVTAARESGNLRNLTVVLPQTAGIRETQKKVPPKMWGNVGVATAPERWLHSFSSPPAGEITEGSIQKMQAPCLLTITNIRRGSGAYSLTISNIRPSRPSNYRGYGYYHLLSSWPDRISGICEICGFLSDGHGGPPHWV